VIDAGEYERLAVQLTALMEAGRWTECHQLIDRARRQAEQAEPITADCGVAELGIEPRFGHLLERLEIVFVRDLLRLSADDLLGVPGVSGGCVAAIERALGRHGLRLRT
jgi:hypothetical protein